MKQLTKEMKSVLTTGHNLDNNEYWLQFGNLTRSDKYVCLIYDSYDNLLARIKYKRHWSYPNIIEEPNIFEWITNDKNIIRTIRNSRRKYA